MFSHFRKRWKLIMVIAILAIFLIGWLGENEPPRNTALAATDLDKKTVSDVFPEAELVCFIPEYQSVSGYLREHNVESELKGHVGENELGIVEIGPAGHKLSYSTRSDGYIHNIHGCVNPKSYTFSVETQPYPDGVRVAKYLVILPVEDVNQ